MSKEAWFYTKILKVDPSGKLLKRTCDEREKNISLVKKRAPTRYEKWNVCFSGTFQWCNDIAQGFLLLQMSLFIIVIGLYEELGVC